MKKFLGLLAAIMVSVVAVADVEVPTGAILIFPRECPKGWSDFTEGQGRFLLGEGTIAVIQDGEAKVETVIAGGSGGQMYHLHDGETSFTRGPNKDNADRDSRSAPQHKHDLIIENTNHIPSYVVVRFCVVP